MIGMLWYDNSKDPLTTKIQRAVTFYLDKYGGQVNTIVVNPADVEECDLPGIVIHPNKQCQRHHLLVSEETVGS